MLGIALIIITTIAALLGIYRGVMVWKQWSIDRSIVKFKNTRRAVKENRSYLGKIALKLDRKNSANLKIISNIPLLARESWFPLKPIPLKSVELAQEQDIPVKIDLFIHNLPKHACGKYKKYSQAIEELDKPERFISLPQYRLLRVDGTKLVFSNHMYSYFDKIDYGEYLVYELAYQKLKKLWMQRLSNRNQFLRQVKDFSDHIILCGVNTLTMLHDGTELRIIMHRRSCDKTATAMGTNHVIPAGEFQPSCSHPGSIELDFSLWKNIMREYAEEILGMDEYDGNSAVPFDYSVEPFVSLENELSNNNIKPFYLGIGLDPASLQAEILTVIVFKEEIFRKIFPSILTENKEGEIITEKNRWGIQFIQKEYDYFQQSNILAAAEAALNITWSHKEFFKKVF